MEWVKGRYLFEFVFAHLIEVEAKLIVSRVPVRMLKAQHTCWLWLSQNTPWLEIA